MNVHVLEREQVLPGTPEEVFPFFADARNLEAITPPLLRFEVVTPEPIEMRVGTLIQYRLRLRGVPVSWLTSIQAWEPPHRFVDVQVRGPYALWHHTHTFAPVGSPPTRTLMRDTVRYAIGFGPLGALAARAFVHRDVAAIFAFRRDAVVAALCRP
ncbi:MAG: SRPBCC family protein [Solirubrobacterales bacterium]|nr:SRPBCC family protein [Solirubrobacterales bacterium]